jgi:hypothetical protein
MLKCTLFAAILSYSEWLGRQRPSCSFCSAFVKIPGMSVCPRSDGCKPLSDSAVAHAEDRVGGDEEFGHARRILPARV